MTHSEGHRSTRGCPRVSCTETCFREQTGCQNIAEGMEGLKSSWTGLCLQEWAWHQGAQSGTSRKGSWGNQCMGGTGDGGVAPTSLPWQCPFLTMM